MTSKVPILLYHDLQSPDFPSEKSNEAASNIVVDVDNFEAQIRYLVENGYNTITIKDYLELRIRNNPIPRHNIIITFDDGHYSNYYLAYPILLKYGFKATFFVIVDRINRQNYLSDEQIKEMSDNGMEIGSHGLTHKYFPLMSPEEMKFELSESRNILESKILKTVGCFAFPGGHFNRDALRYLQEAGYIGACSCLQGLNSLRTNRYLLKRIEIRRNVSLEDFEHILSPSRIAFYQLVDFMKGLFRRLIGLEAYSRLRSRFYKYYVLKR